MVVVDVNNSVDVVESRRHAEEEMKQRGRSPAPKPSKPSDSGSASGLRAVGASSKSLTAELLHDMRWDDSGGSESSVTKEESGLVSVI